MNRTGFRGGCAISFYRTKSRRNKFSFNAWPTADFNCPPLHSKREIERERGRTCWGIRLRSSASNMCNNTRSSACNYVCVQTAFGNTDVNNFFYFVVASSVSSGFHSRRSVNKRPWDLVAREISLWCLAAEDPNTLKVACSSLSEDEAEEQCRLGSLENSPKCNLNWFILVSLFYLIGLWQVECGRAGLFIESTYKMGIPSTVCSS